MILLRNFTCSAALGLSYCRYTNAEIVQCVQTENEMFFYDPGQLLCMQPQVWTQVVQCYNSDALYLEDSFLK